MIARSDGSDHDRLMRRRGGGELGEVWDNGMLPFSFIASDGRRPGQSDMRITFLSRKAVEDGAERQVREVQQL